MFKILHIEDDVADQILVRRMVEKLPFNCEIQNVDTFNSLKELFSLEQDFDLIIADNTIPGANALLIFGFLEEKKLSSDLLIFSSYNEPYFEYHLKRYGVKSIISKDTPDKLLEYLYTSLKIDSPNKIVDILPIDLYFSNEQENSLASESEENFPESSDFLSFSNLSPRSLQRIHFQAISSSIDAYVLLDNTYSIVDYNPAFEKMTEFDKSTIRGLKITQLVDEEFIENVYQFNAEKKSEFGSFETTIILNNKQRLFVEISFSRINVQTGFYSLFIKDITPKITYENELKRQQRETRLNNQILEKLINTTTVGIVVEDEKGEIIKLNESFLKMFEIEEEKAKFIGENYLNLASRFDHFFMLDIPFSILIKGLFQSNEMSEKIQLESVSGKTLLLSYFPVEFVEGNKGSVWQFDDISDQKRNEKLLFESNKKYQLVMDSIDEVFFQFDEKGELLFVSNSFERIVGANKEAIISLIIHNFLATNNPDNSFSLINELRKNSDEKLVREISFENENGETVWLKVNCKGHFEGGWFKGIVGSVSNISKSRQLAAKLDETQSLYEMLSTNISDVVCLHNPKGEILFSSPSFIDLFGFENAEINQQTSWDMIHPDDLVNLKKEYFYDFHRRGHCVFAYRHKTANGGYIWVETYLKKIKDENSDTYKILSSTRSINERKEKESNLVSILSSFENEVLEVNEDLSVENSWSKERVIKNKIGLPQEILPIQNYFPPEVHTQIISAIKKVFKTGKPDLIEYPTLTLDGNGWASAKLNLLELKGIKNVSILKQDITLQKRAEMDLISALQKEKDLVELKSKFVTMTSHEFRTPLTGIQTSADLIGILLNKDFNQSVKGKVSHYLEIIRNEITRVTDLMNDVLLLGKLDSSRTKPTLQTFKLIQLLEEVKLKYQKSFPDSVINLNCSIEMPITSDRRFMEHILDNLIHNAIKYSKEKQIVDVNCSELNGVFEIQVIDYGIGIPESDQKFLFESFFRARNVQDFQGTGLGLAIVKNMVEILGGVISIVSEEMVGTKITLKIKTIHA